MSPLAHVALFLLAVVIAVPLFRKLRLSSVLAYLAAGAVIGPWGLGMVTNVEETFEFAELGVVMLLFVIGLELQPSRLRVMRRSVLGLGSMQMTLTTLLLTGIVMGFGFAPKTAFVAGFALSLSSTPLVLQLLAERSELPTHHGRAAFSILLFQDIAAMPMLALMPLLGEHADQTTADGLWALGKGIVVMMAMVFGGRYVLRPLLRIVAQTHLNEAFSAAALLVVVGSALIANAVGLSMALGAFVAGVLLADSEYRHELEADIEPFKGLLMGLFFIAVGMSVNVGLLLQHPLRILGAVAGLFAVKIAATWIISRLSGHTTLTTRRLSVSLAQAGEFGFVLFSLAVAHRVMEQSVADMFVIVVTLSMALSPLLLSLQTRFLERLLHRDPAEVFDHVEPQGSRVIIAGFGRFGQIVGRVMRMRRIRFTALEASQAQVDFVRRFGNEVYYGDASRLELLQAAGAADAEVLVLAMDDMEASVRTAEIVKRHFPRLKIFARARNRQHALRLMEIGVRYLIRETFLSSLDMSQQVLEALGMSHSDALLSAERFKAHDEKQLQAQLAVKDDEQKLIQTARLASKELEGLFEADEPAITAEVPKIRAVS